MRHADVIIVGGGVFGLSAAWSCRKAGLSVLVLEAGQPGQGASGGVVGALTPHAPTRWRPMMAFQFQALISLEARIAEIEAATGMPCGYARTGRLTPLGDARAREKAEAEAQAAPGVWGADAAFQVLEDVPSEALGWISESAATHGLIRDTISARVDPRAYVRALARGMGENLWRNTPVLGVDPKKPAVFTPRGRVEGRHVVIAAGTASWALAGELEAAMTQGSAVKGQAAVLAADAAGLPLIWQHGLYIIPHGAGRVAVGSTSEKRFADPYGTDTLLDEVLARAREAVPRLADAAVVERWAGLRPKPPGREPVVGPLPGHPSVWMASGGFKIGFGIAHAVGDAIAAGLLGITASIPLPQTFDPRETTIQ